MSRFRSLLFLSMAGRRPLSIQESTYFDNNDTKDYSEQLEFLNSQPYYASKKIVIQSSVFPVHRTGSYRHKKALVRPNN